jgi:hypothetical protein
MCCQQVAACDLGDIADHLGQTNCEAYMDCVVIYASSGGAFADGSVDAARDFDAAAMACDGMGSEADRSNGLSLLECIQSGCSSQCPVF